MGKNRDYQTIIEALDLSPHPEGGFYKEVYRSSTRVRAENKTRDAGTGIYFLLPAGVCSNWHRVRSDELWHFYQGDELVLEFISEERSFQRVMLNNDLSEHSTFQQLVPKDCYQRAYSRGHYSLVGCTVSPGFEFEDFEMIEPQKLASFYPDFENEIVSNPVDDL